MLVIPETLKPLTFEENRKLVASSFHGNRIKSAFIEIFQATSAREIDTCLGYIDSLENKYEEPQRYYHTLKHLYELLSYIIRLEETDEYKNKLPKTFFDALIVLAYYHDAIFYPWQSDSELQSANLFLMHLFPDNNANLTEQQKAIYEAILDTKSHENASSTLSNYFMLFDMAIITQSSFNTLLEYEHNIFKEYQFAPYETYKIERIKLLEKFNAVTNRPEIASLIEYVKFRKISIGFYVGSFSPFHVGHLNVLKKAVKIFDKVIVARGKNPEKQNNINWKTNLAEILPHIQTLEFDGYIVDYVRNNIVNDYVNVALISGIRNTDDYTSKLKECRYNNFLCLPTEEQIQTVFIPSDAEYEHISSSDIRVMESIKKDSAKEYIL